MADDVEYAADDVSKLRDAATDFVGLVREQDVETLQLGIERFGERAGEVCTTLDENGLTAFSLAAEVRYLRLHCLLPSFRFSVCSG